MRVLSAKRLRLIPVVATLGLIGSLMYGLTAANTVPATKAGDGSGVISGYTVSAVKYNLNATNPGNVDSVTFTLDSTPAVGSTIKIKLVSGGTSWYSCTNTGANATCTTTTPQATAASADQLRVIVTD